MIQLLFQEIQSYQNVLLVILHIVLFLLVNLCKLLLRYSYFLFSCNVCFKICWQNLPCLSRDYSAHCTLPIRFSLLIIPWIVIKLKCSLIERTLFWSIANFLKVCNWVYKEFLLTLFVDGVFTTIDDVHATYVLGKDENGEDITVSNLKVIKLLQSLWSRGYVKKTYCWYVILKRYWFVGATSITLLLILVFNILESSFTSLLILFPILIRELILPFLVKRDLVSNVKTVDVMVNVVSVTTALVLIRNNPRLLKCLNEHTK